MTAEGAGSLTLDRAVDWLTRFAARIHADREYLTGLDAAIGDGDHGINMDRGFQAVQQKIAGTPAPDLGALFKTVGGTLVSTVGGASGPIFGTAFLRLGASLAGKSSATPVELGAALQEAYEGMAARGKSGRGEKTVLDSFGPALDAFQAAAVAGRALPEATAAAATAAAAGMERTIPLRATKGRASFLGDNSIGHQDPGATSVATLFRTLDDSVQP